ncbi:MAG: hypothetical protein LBH25_06385 [Fibromonadaceae bacterium]|jgi:hypothetical protein|nr:hypothetical protein [Fibromonadaceae bacterium]
MKKIILCFFVFLFYSCGELETEYIRCSDSISYPYWSEWTDGVLVSIVNDSLAALMISKYKTDCGEWSVYEEITHYRPGLFLVNYRTKQKPLLGDTLVSEYKVNRYNMKLDLRILGGYLFRDSSALVFDLKNNKFGFWKIGEKTIKFSDHNDVGDHLESARNAGHWKNGSIVFYDYYYMNILNTEKRQIESFWYSTQDNWMPEHEWMQRYTCNDLFLSYAGDKVVCAVTRYGYYVSDETIRDALLLVDGIPVDSIVFSSGIFPNGRMFGNYFLLNDDISSSDRIFKIDTLNLKFDRDFSLWFDRYPLRFYNDKINNPDDFVSYSEEDLINFKGEQP